MTPAARPPRLFGDAMLLAFLFTQAFDGVLTYLGIMTYGVQIEGNPILAWCVGALGAGVAIPVAKVFAAMCAGTLHRYARHRTLGVLTILYLAAAVQPWIRVLTD